MRSPRRTKIFGTAAVFFCVYVFFIGNKIHQSTLQLIDSRRQMAQSARRADSANRAKSNFLALMSHEIRTPMTGIFGMIDFLKETPLSAEQRDFVTTIRDCSKTLLNTLNDILDFSKIESGKLEISPINYDFHTVMNNASRLLTQMAESKGWSAPGVRVLVIGLSYAPEIAQAMLRQQQATAVVGARTRIVDGGWAW